VTSDPRTSIDPIAVAAGSIDVRIGDLDGNLTRIASAVRMATEADARLIVLPELATSGYVFTSRDEAAAQAISSDDGRLTRLADDLVDDAVLVVGFAEHAAGRLYSSAAVIDRRGVLAVYRKTHLWGDESLWFDAGDAPPPVVETALGRIGVAVCYDAEFPEVPRGLALAGADLLALPVNWPLVERPAEERPPEVILAMAAARASRLPIVVADRAGRERGVPWTDGTAVIDADGWIASAEPGHRAGAFATATLDLARSRDKRIGGRNHLLDDRRPRLYGTLVEDRRSPTLGA
jgi:predicted amidohydrolase